MPKVSFEIDKSIVHFPPTKKAKIEGQRERKKVVDLFLTGASVAQVSGTTGHSRLAIEEAIRLRIRNERKLSLDYDKNEEVPLVKSSIALR